MKLAIKGHSTRGKEVIELLKMMGGCESGYCGGGMEFYYYISRFGNIEGSCEPYEFDTYIVYTLEEFLEKYPFKVGDMARFSRSNISVIVKEMKWENNEIVYKLSCDDGWWSVDNLKPYKEKTIEESANKAIFEGNAQSCDIMNDIIKKAMEQIKIDIPEGYEFFGIDDNNKIVLTKIQPQYPKTYQECCEVLGIGSYFEPEIRNTTTEECNKFTKLMRLKRCRDAYWKIAGEQMGLNEPWKPDWKNSEERRYCIVNIEGDINLPEKTLTKWILKITNKILVFPTEEIRDMFYKNFKDLIEQCKELL